MPKWDLVRGISSNKIIISTSIWVFIVPAIMKTADILNTNIQGNEFDFITLPLTFSILYFSGVSFFLGATIYNLFCPNLIKDNDSYSAFSNKGGNCFCLEAYINTICTSDSTKLKHLLVANVGEASPNNIDNGNYYCIALGKNKDMFTFEKEKLSDVFWVIYHFMMPKRCLFIYLSLTFHFIGFSGLMYMFLYNFNLVINGVM